MARYCPRYQSDGPEWPFFGTFRHGNICFQTIFWARWNCGYTRKLLEKICHSILHSYLKGLPHPKCFQDGIRLTIGTQLEQGCALKLNAFRRVGLSYPTFADTINPRDWQTSSKSKALLINMHNGWICQIIEPTFLNVNPSNHSATVKDHAILVEGRQFHHLSEFRDLRAIIGIWIEFPNTGEHCSI